jgi:peptidoglycan/xylan/chitin deacetylase (PgdA/CDA1 family)
MFYDSGTANAQFPDDSRNLEKVLKFLSENKVRALFFMSGEEILNNPDKLRMVFAAGQDIGLKISHASPTDLINELEETNAYIYALIKQKTRLCMYADANISGAEMTAQYAAELEEAGYFLCSENVKADSVSLNGESAAVEFLKRSPVNLCAFDFSSFENNYAALEMIARAADVKFYINFSHINNANISGLK